MATGAITECAAWQNGHFFCAEQAFGKSGIVIAKSFDIYHHKHSCVRFVITKFRHGFESGTNCIASLAILVAHFLHIVLIVVQRKR